MSTTYNRIGMIARWQPVHLGHAAILKKLCETGRHVLIGIGSSNRQNARNPFTLEEINDMLALALAGFDNFSLIPVPDLDDGPRWHAMVVGLFGALDVFVTENPYVTHLLASDYRILRPVSLLPPNEQVPVDGTQVRAAMARGDGWQALVPERIAEYIQSRKLDVRFRNEFGLETLALGTIIQ